MNTLQTLLLRADWAKSLSYTIDGLMAPWGGFLVEDFRLLKKQFLTKTWNRICTNGHYQICPFIFCLPSFGKVIPFIHLCQFPAVITVCLSITVYEKSLIKQSILYPLYCTSWNGSLRLIMSKSWDLFNYTFRGKTRVSYLPLGYYCLLTILSTVFT